MTLGFKIISETEYEKEHQVGKKQVSMINKFNSGSCEVNIYNFPSATDFYFDSPSTPDSCKTYYLLSGSCRCIETSQIVRNGDLITIEYGNSIFNFHALEDVTFLVHAINNTSFSMLKNNSDIIYTLLDEIQEKDHYTKTHCVRVFYLCRKLAENLGYKSDRLYDINMASGYHDIGKIHIEDSILNKPESLDEEEFQLMKQHVVLGKELIVPHFGERVFEIISQHHERIDGSGYPLGLKGDQINEEARILAICDSYDAMVTDRVYKKGKSKNEAITELKSLAGIKYDATIVNTFIEMLETEE